MFTGLIEHMGTVAELITPRPAMTSGPGYSLLVTHAAPVLADCHVGDSICVNGACLTVTHFSLTDQGGQFGVGLAPETIARTNLGQLKPGDQVNLERAMLVGSRYGGHIVQGHVDTTATVISVTPDGDSIRFRFALSKASPHLVPKGYVTLDGTSLTLTDVSLGGLEFGIMLIAHSQERVSLTHKRVGDRVNVEFDVVAKGIERMVEHVLGLDSVTSISNTQPGVHDNSPSMLHVMIEQAVDRALDQRGLKKVSSPSS